MLIVIDIRTHGVWAVPPQMTIRTLSTQMEEANFSDHSLEHLKDKSPSITRRSRLEIMADILIFTRTPRTKSQVLKEVNLSWPLLNRYLDQMQSLGLLGVHHSPKKYATTTKGLKFLDTWAKLAQLFKQYTRSHVYHFNVHARWKESERREVKSA